MKKILLLAMLLGLTGCGDNNQSDTTQTGTRASTLQKAEVTPVVANYSLAASPSTMGAVAPLAGWNITNSMVTGASILIDAVKESKTSFAQVKPNAKQVAEVLRGGAAGIALTIAVDQLLGAVDWVMDPVNNQIKYHEKVVGDFWFITINGMSEQIAYPSYLEACNAFFESNNDKENDIYPVTNPEGYWCQGYKWGTRTTQRQEIIKEKTLPLETVAEKVISNAETGSLDAQVATNLAAQNILNDVVQAEPIVQELENNAKKPPCVTVSGKVVTVGTYGYRHDKVPPSKPHYPFTGDHYNLYRANQNPNNGKCFWVESGAADASDGKLPPPNSIPIEPFI